MGEIVEFPRVSNCEVIECYLVSLCEVGCFDKDSDDDWIGVFEDVRSEIVDMWLPLFRTKDNLELALSVVRDGYDGLVSDVASLYIEVLSKPLVVELKS
jgi:hypothetical protein